MGLSVESITEAVLSLPDDARALLADRLVESLDPLTDESIRDAWVAESLRRLDDVRSGRVRTISRDDVLARVHAKIK
jgi:putative addiction module component (TIGR02574 family)